MTKETASCYAKLYQAIADGKTVQFIDNNVWVDCKDFETCTYPVGFYRVKPEPRRFWLVSGSNFTDLQNAVCYANATSFPSAEIIEVVEVIK